MGGPMCGMWGLWRLLDTFEKGEVIFGQTGFGFLMEKSLHWFDQDGDPMGGIETEHPLRRFYFREDGFAVETRQNQAILDGVPSWWR